MLDGAPDVAKVRVASSNLVVRSIVGGKHRLGQRPASAGLFPVSPAGLLQRSTIAPAFSAITVDSAAGQTGAIGLTDPPAGGLGRHRVRFWARRFTQCGEIRPRADLEWLIREPACRFGHGASELRLVERCQTGESAMARATHAIALVGGARPCRVAPMTPGRREQAEANTPPEFRARNIVLPEGPVADS